MEASLAALERPRGSASNTVFKSGPLFISSKGLGWTSWKKRWFILTRTSLVFFKNDPGTLPQKGGEVNLTLGGIDLNNSGSVVVREDKKLLTVLFPDGRDGRAFTLKAETFEDLYEWKTALEQALAQAPNAALIMGQNGIFRAETNEAIEGREKRPLKSLVVGRPILLALEDIDGSPSFLEKALQFIEKYGTKIEGILRQSADVEEVERRVQEYEQGKTEFTFDEDPHVVGDCIKHVLRELPSSPVSASCCTALLEAYRIESKEARISSLRSAIAETFPEPNRRLLQRILKMMHTISSHSHENRMNPNAVAACMAPLLLRPLLAGECDLEDDFDGGEDNSAQLLAAANAANNAQAIITVLLEDYGSIFDEENIQRCSISTESHIGNSGPDDSSDDDNNMKNGYHNADNEVEPVTDDDNDRALSGKMSESSGCTGSDLYEYKGFVADDSDIESPRDTNGPRCNSNIRTDHLMRNPFVNSTDQQAGEQIGDDPTKYGVNSCLAHVSESYQQSGTGLNVPTHGNTLAAPGLESPSAKSVNKGTPSSVHAKRATFWGRGSARKISTDGSFDSSGEDELAIQRLETTKNELRQRIAKEARGNAILQASLERRKQALHERRLSLEQDVSRLQEQLQAERDLRAALEVGLSMVVFDAKYVCQAKTQRWQIMRQSRLRVSTGQCCPVCIPNVTSGNAKVVSNLKNLLDIYNISATQKSMFGCFVDDLKFFYLLKSQEYKYIYNEVLEDEVVKRAIAAAARNACADDAVVGDSRFDEEMRTQQANTRRILTIISANVKNWVYKVIGWFTYRMISLLATSLVVQPTQIEKVREAEQSGLPVIYLPLHKSHMDYILLGLVLTVNNIKPPLVAAGENLRVFFISKLLSFLGAFYIKRHVDTKKDQLYWSVLSSYIKNSMKNGHHIEFFLEGARTRSGKCCVPKAGLLSIIVEAYREKVIEDAWIVPVSMNYDRILEGNFVREQLGQPKKKETFFAAISTFIKAICSHYGIMRVDFNEPYRLRDLYESIDKLTQLENESLQKNGMEMMSTTIRYKNTVDRMAKHIVYDCWKSTPIMSTHAVCFLLLNKHRNGTTLEQLAKDLSMMRDKLSQADRDVGFSGSSIEVIKHALDLLGPKLVVCENTDSGRIVKPILDVPALIELSYYGNNLISHFMHQSLVALTICKLVNLDFWNNDITETKISRNELIEDVLFLINLLQFDFVFIKPCDSLDNIVDRVIRRFEEEEIILIDLMLEEERRSQTIANMLDGDSDDDDYQQPYVEIDVKYRVNTNENSLNKLKFYRSVMMPYLECMAESAGSFLAVSENSVIEREHVQTILNQMHENLEEGILSYGESISLDTIKHSFLAFELFNCLQITTKDNVKTLHIINNQPTELNPSMQGMSEYIEQFVKQIN